MKLKIDTFPVSFKVESNYILISRKRSCTEFVKKTPPSEAEILEFHLALHFVLEIGVNAFFRNYYGILSNLDEFKNDHEMDHISFLDKIRFFLSSNKFTFQNGTEVKESYKKAKDLIRDVKIFNNIRNLIVHGHSVSEIRGEINKLSELKQKLTSKSAQEQINRFIEIIFNLNYFVDRLETVISKDQIKSFQKSFLSTDFLSN